MTTGKGTGSTQIQGVLTAVQRDLTQVRAKAEALTAQVERLRTARKAPRMAAAKVTDRGKVADATAPQDLQPIYANTTNYLATTTIIQDDGSGTFSEILEVNNYSAGPNSQTVRINSVEQGTALYCSAGNAGTGVSAYSGSGTAVYAQSEEPGTALHAESFSGQTIYADTNCPGTAGAANFLSNESTDPNSETLMVQGASGQTICANTNCQGAANFLNNTSTDPNSETLMAQGNAGMGVYASSSTGTGLVATSTQGSGAIVQTEQGPIAMLCENLSSDANSIGFVGYAGNGTGIGAVGVFGVVGQSNADGGIAVEGDASGSGAAGVFGSATGGPGSAGVKAYAAGVDSAALQVDGRAIFSSSGQIVVPADAHSVVQPGLSLSPTAFVLATLQQNLPRVSVRAAVADPAAGTVTVYLTAPAPAGGATVAWMVVN
jgi:hypothetical protein